MVAWATSTCYRSLGWVPNVSVQRRFRAEQDAQKRQRLPALYLHDSRQRLKSTGATEYEPWCENDSRSGGLDAHPREDKRSGYLAQLDSGMYPTGLKVSDEEWPW